MFVYVMAAANNSASKIGISRSPLKRLSAVRTGNHSKTELWRCFPCPAAAAPKIEREAHRLLAAYRTSGEWFDVHPDVAATFVKSLISGEPAIETARRLLDHFLATGPKAPDDPIQMWRFSDVLKDKNIVQDDPWAWVGL